LAYGAAKSLVMDGAFFVVAKGAFARQFNASPLSRRERVRMRAAT
jgi:hypothetical protein